MTHDIATDPAASGWRDDWPAGTLAWFEYRCWESDNSADAELWHRSHQQVTIDGPLEGDPAAAGLTTIAERLRDCLPGYYPVRFADGYVGCACEDELLTGPEWYERPGPPAREQEASAVVGRKRKQS
jgi:hypothetical protein